MPSSGSLMARPKFTRKTVSPTVIKMGTKPAMPEIISLDSLPSTVNIPCEICMPTVSTTPTLYSQKNQLNS